MIAPITYGSVNDAVLAALPGGARRILDVGCGTGVLGARLKELENQRFVVGVTHSELEAAEARNALDQVLVEDLETATFNEIGTFDCIVCSHVLEHLRNPAQVLTRLRKALAPGGTVLVALPNALYWRQRLRFAAGHFRYTVGGVMDSTHLVFFDWITAQELIADAGLRLLSATADGGFPGSRFLGRIGELIDSVSLSVAPGLVGTQFVLVAQEV